MGGGVVFGCIVIWGVGVESISRLSPRAAPASLGGPPLGEDWVWGAEKDLRALRCLPDRSGLADRGLGPGVFVLGNGSFRENRFRQIGPLASPAGGSGPRTRPAEAIKSPGQ